MYSLVRTVTFTFHHLFIYNKYGAIVIFVLCACMTYIDYRGEWTTLYGTNIDWCRGQH